MRPYIILIMAFVSVPCLSYADFLDSISQLGRELTSKSENTAKVAIVEFVDLDGSVNSLGKFIAEELITEIALIEDREITVVERGLLMKILAEQKISVSELVEPDAIKNVGELIGADSIVTGTLTDLGDKIRVNARIISTKSGEVRATARASIPATGIIKELSDFSSDSKLKRQIPSQNATHTASWSGFDLLLAGCSKTGSSGICKFKITATQTDSVLNIHRETAVFDDSGNKMLISGVQHGASSVIDSQRYSYIYQELIAGVPLITKISFPLKDSDATSISSFRMAVSKSDRPKKQGKVSVISFRDLPF